MRITMVWSENTRVTENTDTLFTYIKRIDICKMDKEKENRNLDSITAHSIEIQEIHEIKN